MDTMKIWRQKELGLTDVILNHCVSNSRDQHRNIINLDLFSHDSYESFLVDVPYQWLEIGVQMGGRVQGQVGGSQAL